MTDAGDPAPVRSYSLSSAPGATTYRISVKLEDHGLVSGYVHTRLRPGAIVEAAAPRGDFVLETDGVGPVLLLSAGVGATPVLAMLHQLVDAGSARDVWWVHVARDRSQHAFADEAHRLLASLEHGHEHVFYTRPGAAPPATEPAVVGRPTAPALAELGVPADATAYVCGPAGFMADMTELLTGLGIAAERIHTELFGARPAINPGVTGDRPARPHQPSGPSGTGARVTFARSGLTVRWSPDRRTLLDLADNCDVPTRFSCRTGVCHTCVTPVLAGDVEYALAPLELPAAGTTLICCARPAGDVVLDL
jgi:ferredoxin-NADP reductase